MILDCLKLEPCFGYKSTKKEEMILWELTLITCRMIILNSNLKAVLKILYMYYILGNGSITLRTLFLHIITIDLINFI